jgi:hypothetical protein
MGRRMIAGDREFRSGAGVRAQPALFPASRASLTAIAQIDVACAQ